MEFDFSWRRWFVGYWSIRGIGYKRHAFYIGPLAVSFKRMSRGKTIQVPVYTEKVDATH